MIDPIFVPVGVVVCALGLAGLAGGAIGALSWRLQRSEAEIRRLRGAIAALARESRRNERDSQRIRRHQLIGQESAPGSTPIVAQSVDKIPPPQSRPGARGYYCHEQHGHPNDGFQNANLHWHPPTHSAK